LATTSLLLWLMGAGSAASPLLVWDAGAWLTRPWSAWTAALVHLSGTHLLANALALAALAVLGRALRAGPAAALALLAAWPLTTLGLLAWPQVSGYAGLSGLIHAAVAVLWAHAAVRREGWPLSYLLFVALLFKLVVEHAWTTPVAFDPAWGFNVVYAAHLSGAVAGMACGLAAALWPSRAVSGSA
jgi:rhomboid family GlyGly-CTERM serine protease